MTERVDVQGLQVERGLYEFIQNEALPGTGVEANTFWVGFAALLGSLTAKNRSLLKKREELQSQIDGWHRDNGAGDPAAYRAFLTEIGYLTPEGEAFEIETRGVDYEIAMIAGPQLVVPITNARYALNAANARWGSLYDALYGTDAMGDLPPAGGYSVDRGDRVIDWAMAFLDDVAPLNGTGWAARAGFEISDGNLRVETEDGRTVRLQNEGAFVGYAGERQSPTAILLRNNGIHIELKIDREDQIGKRDAAGIADIILEAALTTIMDCEDSVACVDAEDKTLAYRNWLGLMKGDLSTDLQKGGKTVTRALNTDREYTSASGGEIALHGRSLMLVRNVGHLMTNPAILDRDGNEVFEGLMDAAVTALIALHDIRADKPKGTIRNSRTGSMYVVKPKMHGPAEVAFADEIFARVEDFLATCFAYIAFTCFCSF